MFSEVDLDGGFVLAEQTCPAILAAFREEVRIDESDMLGDYVLRQLFADYLTPTVGLKLQANQVMITGGSSTAALNLAFLCSSVTSDRSNYKREILMFSPMWFGYQSIIGKLRIPMRRVETTEADGFKPTPGSLRKALDKNVAAFVINNFATPTGAMLSCEDLAELAAVLRDFPHVTVIEDALFLANSFSDNFPSILKVAPWLLGEGRYVGTTSLSKGWAVNADLVGFMWGDSRKMEILAELALAMNKCPNGRKMFAARAAFTAEGLKTPLKVRQAVNANLCALNDSLEYVGDMWHLAIQPEGGTNAFLDVRHSGMEGLDFVKLLRHRTGLEFAEGEAFSAPGHVRINLAGAHPGVFRHVVCQRLEGFLQTI